MRKACYLVVAMTALLLPACGSKPQQLIVGKWQTTDLLGKVKVAEFSKDGTASLPLPFVDLRADGKYKFVDNDHIEIEFGSSGKPQKRRVEVTKETLTLTDEQGKAQIFKRVE
jgi:uncharacterized protein (TIGR03066 family)